MLMVLLIIYESGVELLSHSEPFGN